jgi:penicillin amidase
MSPNKSQVKSRWRRLLLYVGGAGLLLVLFLGGLAAWFFHVAKAALPLLDGQLAVTGLLQPLSVSRDDHGVPTITAGSLTDLFFAQGYVTAQDRLWQMDMTRRFASGEIAELLGAEWVKHDREQRILRLRATAEQNAQELSPRDRVFLEAYSSGVNAYITAHEKNLPLEFHLLRYSPRPWTPADTLVIYANMVKELNHWGGAPGPGPRKSDRKSGAGFGRRSLCEFLAPRSPAGSR